MNDDLFEQIDKNKEDLPTLKRKIKYIKNYNYNFYQKVAIFIMVVAFFSGVILGNVFPACQSGFIYSDTCSDTEFNAFLTILVWFISFIFSMFIFFLGHVIQILDKIAENTKK
jgi:hypothetical protein